MLVSCGMVSLATDDMMFVCTADCRGQIVTSMKPHLTIISLCRCCASIKINSQSVVIIQTDRDSNVALA